MISSQPTFNHCLRGWVSVANPNLAVKSRTVQYYRTRPLDLISSSGFTIGTFSVNSTSLAMRQFVTGIWHSSAAGAIILLILLPSGAQQAQNYGETCLSDIECVDHRMLCEARVTDSSVKHCYCNRFYIWDEELKQCSQIYNNTIELTSNYEEQDNNKLHSMSEHKMFITMSIIGLIAVISICTFLLSCTAYGCSSCTRIRDQKTNPPAVSCPPTCPLHSVPLLQQDKPLVEQAKKTQWQDMPCSMTSVLDIDTC